MPLPKVKDLDIDSINKIVLIDLIVVIHAITGWKLPDDAAYLKALCLEVSLMLVEDFATLNFDEIKMAFRKNRHAVKDWGKSMNLVLISEVLGAYCTERTRIGNEEMRIKSAPTKQRLYSDEEITNQRRGEFEKAYQAMKLGHLPLIYDYYEPLLRSDGILSVNENITDFIVKSLGANIESIYQNKN